MFKRGVSIFGLQPQMVFAYLAAQDVYRELNNYKHCVITSATDGKHKRGSDHYVGLAIDLRTWGFEDMGIPVATVADMIQERLTDEFEVIAEPTHIHIGFDPQTGLNKDE